MEEGEIERFKLRLKERHRALLDAGDVPIEATRKSETQIGGDEDEQPLTEMSQALASSRNRVRTQEIKALEDAMRRLAEDPERFGLCELCEEAISAKRLEFMPHARLCVSCQSKTEPSPRAGPRKNLTDYV
jgi:DnaK suppressor protein